MEFKELCELIEAAGYSVRSYSGRSMYGKICLGIDTKHADIVPIVLNIISEYIGQCNGRAGRIDKAQDLCELLMDPRSDSMGKGYIVYFPAILWEELDSED
jgi:hypothetical protein